MGASGLVASKGYVRVIAARLNGFTMLLRRDLIIIAISTLIGIALAYGVHSLP